jgi:hypothetical protein
MNSTIGTRRLAPAAVALAVWVADARTQASAQPEPSFRSTCRDLRKSAEKLDFNGERLIVIQVVGPLTNVQFDGALA